MEQKKKLPLPILIILIGIGIGLVVAGIGLYKQVDSKRVNKNRADIALKESQKAADKANARLKEIEDEYYPLSEKHKKKQNECDSIEVGSNDWFAKKNQCDREVQEMQERLWALEAEVTAIQNKDYTGYYNEVKPMSYQIFYIVGASITGVALLGAFIIYLVKGKKTY